MRCKCCDSPNTRFVLGDFYCLECSKSIKQTILDDKLREAYKSWYEKDIEEIDDGQKG